MSKASDLARLITSGSTAIHGEAGVTSSGSTGATTTLQQGLAKAWTFFDGGAGTPSHADSLNASTLTDTAGGECTLTFTTAFDDAADYCIPVGTLNTSASQENITIYTKATGNFKTYNYNSGGAGGLDPEAFYITCMGDLA